MIDHKSHSWKETGNAIGRLSDGTYKKRVDKDGISIEKRRMIEDIKDKIAKGEK